LFNFSYFYFFVKNQGTVDRGYSDQLVLPRATVQDSGVYTCEATSARGQSARGSTNLYITCMSYHKNRFPDEVLSIC